MKFCILHRCIPLICDPHKPWYVTSYSSALNTSYRFCLLRIISSTLTFGLLKAFKCVSALFHAFIGVSVTLQMVPVSAPANKGPEHIQGSAIVPNQSVPKAVAPKVLQGTIPSGHIPKPVILPDYIA